MPPLPVQRAEVHAQGLIRTRLSVADAQGDDVPLVALQILQVLDEQVEKNFAVDGGLEDGAVPFQAVAQFRRVGQVSGGGANLIYDTLKFVQHPIKCFG